MSATKTLSFRPSLETMEERCLMASGITASFKQGVLSIGGTSAADRIHLRESSGRVTLDGFTGSISSSQIKGIVIDAKSGDDVIAMDFSATLASKTATHGGSGRDTIICSSRATPGKYSGLEAFLDTATYSSERSSVDSAFEGLRGEFQVSGKSTRTYNCIAWSLGITSRWINPGKSWAECDKINSTNGGYKRMNGLDFSLVKGYEKIVLYGKVDSQGRVTEFTHQARQLSDGTWTSKLGGMAEIRHATPDTVGGSSYGRPVAVYYRYNPNF